MNITFHTINTDYLSLTRVAGRQRHSAERASDDFDTVTISSAKDAKPAAGGDAFARILAREAAKEAEKGVEPKRVAQLHQQVVSGDYHPDPARIAERILGYR